MKVAYFFPTQRSDFEDALENVVTAAPYFDDVIVVEDSGPNHAFTSEQKTRLIESGHGNVDIRSFPFEDDHPKMYQHGVNAALELGADWLAFGDADEHFCEAFLKDVHKICEELEQKDLDMVGLKCHAQFSIANAVWPSSLSVDIPEGGLKEAQEQGHELEKYPDKIVVTNDHKYMLMKCYPDLKWEGVGRTKTVHTTWNSASHPWKSAFLPDEYWYLHRKTPLQVFKSAARNMWLSGGGANLGDVNTMWVELKELMKKEKVSTWAELEHYVEDRADAYPNLHFDGNTVINAWPRELIDWIRRALVWKATDYGTETRQTGLWMLYYWRALLDISAIAYGIQHPPRLTQEDKTERYVQEQYLAILGRWPDKQGLDFYKNDILQGRITPEMLPGLLRESPEFASRPTTEKEEKHIQLPVDVKVTLDENTVTQILMESEIYKRVMKPRLDVGKFLEEQLGKKFFDSFYDMRNKGELTLPEFVRLLGRASAA